METVYEIMMFFLNILCKLSGVVITLLSIAFYLNGSMTLESSVMMIICSFMIFESLDQVGAFSSLTRAIENCVDKANALAAAWISAGNLWMMGGLLAVCSKQH